MGLRYSKRIGGSKGFGLNVSGSGVSSSYRGKYGSIGSKAFSIKSGIPGVTYRSSWGTGKNKGNGALIMMAVLALVFVVTVSVLIVYNVFRFLRWGIVEIYHWNLRRKALKDGFHTTDTPPTTDIGYTEVLEDPITEKA